MMSGSHCGGPRACHRSASWLALTVASALVSRGAAAAPDDPTPTANLVYVELLGTAYGVSVNYERVLWRGDWAAVQVRAGIGAGALEGVCAPLLATLLVGGERHHVELAAGLQPVWSFRGSGQMYPLPAYVAGYRYQPRGECWLARVSVAASAFLPVPGVSVGRTF